MLKDVVKIAQKKPDATDATGFAKNVATGAEVPNYGVPEVAGLVFNVVMSAVGIIFLILMIYGGITWMTARGDEQQIESARTTVFRAIVGILVVVGSYAIVNFFFNVV
ncbi:MAG: hypothetical protein ABEJ24_00100 [Candidatus Magasanikbacteria bacterium]